MIIFRVPQARKMYHMSFKITEKNTKRAKHALGKNLEYLMYCQKNKLD